MKNKRMYYKIGANNVVVYDYEDIKYTFIYK